MDKFCCSFPHLSVFLCLLQLLPVFSLKTVNLLLTQCFLCSFYSLFFSVLTMTFFMSQACFMLLSGEEPLRAGGGVRGRVAWARENGGV